MQEAENRTVNVEFVKQGEDMMVKDLRNIDSGEAMAPAYGWYYLFAAAPHFPTASRFPKA